MSTVFKIAASLGVMPFHHQAQLGPSTGRQLIILLLKNLELAQSRSCSLSETADDSGTAQLLIACTEGLPSMSSTGTSVLPLKSLKLATQAAKRGKVTLTTHALYVRGTHKQWTDTAGPCAGGWQL